MSLDVINFLRDEFLHKYEKLKNSRSSIDAPLRKIFRDYEALLNGIEDIASLQGADKDLLYDLNCAVDDCLVESADQSLHSMAKRSFRRCKQRGVSLENREKLEKYLPELKAIISSQCGSSVSAPHKPASIPLVNYVVHGFQNQFDDIVKKISISSEEESNMRAVGIVGIGGSGKTTLASMVFNSREVREKYKIMIWASLTSTLNKKESTRGSVFREILVGAQNNNNLKTMLKKYYQGGSDHTLDKYLEHFKETLKRNNGKYLIVLDDVWETEYWFAEKEEEGSEAKCILSREWIEKTGGTVVVTSRLEEMAENIVGKKNLYMMLPVEKEPCFEIFLDRATKDGHFSREDEQLRKLKKDIEDRCYGLPLAACTVADIIVAKKRKEEEAKKEMDAAKAKAEAEAEAEASASKAEAGGEADGSKVKAETEGEAGGSKAETEGEAGGSKAEGDTAAAKMEAEGDVAALKAESEREADALKGKTEEAAAASKAEGEADALEAKIEGKGKAEADVAKAETEGDVSKALSGDTGEGTHGELDAWLEKEQE
ncbi:hypothetical protein QQ045_025425 [Rhodiola kirilowii]